MDSRAKELSKHSAKLFENRWPLLSLWQTMALNFYPARADFTTVRNLGDEFTEGLFSSAPIIMHRELSGMMSSLMRQGDWFRLSGTEDSNKTSSAAREMDRMTKIQRDKMYASRSGFVRASKQADMDWTAFGQAVKSCELTKDRRDLLIRNWHLRDVAWAEQDNGQVGQVSRKWKPYAYELMQLFPDSVSDTTRKIADKTPYERIQCYHVITPMEIRNTTEFGEFEYTSTYYEENGHHILEDIGTHNRYYVIPRWLVTGETPYAYSPATMAAIPDARLLQAITLTLLEAGEKFTNPPLLGQDGMIRGDLQVYAGGVSWINPDYDERMGDVLRPLSQNASGMPIGFEMANSIRDQLSDSMYLNKLMLPDIREMTAYEAGLRMQEQARATLPILEPIEEEDNRQMCDVIFDLLFRNGDFGSPVDIIRTIGDRVEFEFESPIKKFEGKEKQGEFHQMIQMYAAGVEADPIVRHSANIDKAFRDAMDGMGYPAEWVKTDEESAASAQMEQMMMAAQQNVG